jgi:hypothetical protein
MLTCRQCRTEIETTAWPETLSAHAAEHAATCSACRAFQAERQSLRRLIGELEPVGAPPDFEFRLRARMQARQGAARAFGFWPLMPRIAGLAVAAGLVLGFALTLRWHGPEPTPDGNRATAQGTAQSPAPMSSPEQTEALRKDVAVVTPAVAPKNGTTVLASSRGQRRLPAVARADTPAPLLHQAVRTVNEVNDLALQSANVVTANDAGSEAAPLPPIAVPVPAAAKPLKVLVTDPQGAARLVSIEAVSFGSRDLLAGRVQPTIVKTSAQGVW